MTANRRSKPSTPNFDDLGERERSVVLKRLLDAHPDLLAEADQIATDLLTTVDADAVAEDVMWKLAP